jgi:hypothetical protein
MKNWDIPGDPDTDAAGDRGYGEEEVHDTDLPEDHQPDNNSEISTGEFEFDTGKAGDEYDPGDYVGTDFDQWNRLGIELPEGDD